MFRDLWQRSSAVFTPWLVRARWFCVRHVPLRLVLVAVLGLGAVGAVAATERRAAAEQARWGTLQPVVVAVVDLAPGSPLGPAEVEVRRLPTAAIPPGALTAVPAGALVTDFVMAGEVVAAHRTTQGSGRGALLPAGTSGVGVPLVALTWVPALGDAVTLVTTLDEVGLDPLGDATTSAHDGQVVAVDDQSVLVAVPDAVAAEMARFAANGRIGLLLRRSTGQ